MSSEPLSPEERQEVFDLYMRLHRLFPERGHDRHAREGFPENAGRAELADLRQEVEREEYLAGREVEREDEDGE